MTKGQVIVTTVLIIAVLLLAVIVSIYETRLVYLRTRSIVVREVVGSITADFERALAHVLALATRAYFNYTRYEKMLKKYKTEGLTLYNKHNFTIAREIGFKYLELWKTFVMEAYSGYGVEIDFEASEKDLRIYLNRPREIGEGELMKGFWYYPFSASIINAKLRLNLTNVGFYGWRSEVTVGLYLKIHNFTVPDDPGENWTQLIIGVLYDKGEPYPYLLAKGFVEVYIPVQGRWRKANITDFTYIGNGNYSVTIEPYLEPEYDLVTGEEFIPVLVVIGDDRGILVEACSYTHITFKIRRNIPDPVPYGAGEEVYCEGDDEQWNLTGQNGYVLVTNGLKFRPKTRTTITIRYADGTEEDIVLPKRNIYFYFDHDSRIHGGGRLVFTSSELRVENMHMSKIDLGDEEYTDITIVNAYVQIYSYPHRRESWVYLEFYGNWLDMNSPCGPPYTKDGNWYVWLKKMDFIQNLVISNGGTRLDVDAEAKYGIVKRMLGGIERPYNTKHEVYTLEFAWDLNIYWLGIQLPKDQNLELPPIPFIPIKQLRVNVSLDGTENTLEKRPIQYEEWKTVNWTGVDIMVPLGMSDPQEDYKPTTRLVFQVKFPTKGIQDQIVAIWWEDDLDAEPEAYPTQIEYISGGNYKDVRHPLYDIEFVDLEHSQSRGYANYEGVTAFVMRDPATDEAFGPYNLHAFDEYYGWKGRYRPYGVWDVNYEYMRYSWIKAPIRIFAILNTTLVGDVYDDTYNYWESYYHTIAIVQIINGTRYIPVITYIYWNQTHTGYGYWLNLMMGRGYPEHFAFLHNNTAITYFGIGDLKNSGTIEEPNPGFMITHWNSEMGRALVISNQAIRYLKSIKNDKARMASTYGGWVPYQGSIEYEFWSYSDEETVYGGTLLTYWSVIFDYKPLGGDGWLTISDIREGWKNAYIYAPMFLEDYAPMIIKP